jgi:hypothetical protein
VNGGAAVRLRREQHAFSLRLGYDDVETAPAALKGIQRADLTAGYAFVTPGQRIEVSASQFAYDDGNRRTDFHALALRLLGSDAEWGLGASVDLENSLFGPKEYYAPQGLSVGMARVSYRRTWSDSTAVGLGGGFGVAHDDTHGTRRSGLADLAFSRWWGARHAFGTVLGFEWRSVPGYRSVSATVRLEARF